jgi:hypothetical protein
MSNPAPTAEDARRVARDVLGESIAPIERFNTGAGNWVFDVTGQSGGRAVVRFMRSDDECAAGVEWSSLLRSMGVPLPRLLAHHRVHNERDRPSFSWMVLERLPGTDLEHAYAGLDAAQKQRVLDGVLGTQWIVQTLPDGNGFGYTNQLGHAPHTSWYRVIAENLERSRQRIAEVGVVDVSHVDRVARLLPQFDDYFASVRSLAFLDDTTTRNVIVHEGAFAGIVDVDSICYGDPLLVPSLTRMALLNMRCDTLYTDSWLDCVNATPEERRAVDFYTAGFAINFLSEQGQQFNRDAPPPIDPAEVDRLIAILDMLLGRL